MNSLLKNILIISVSSLCVVGASVGVYFGTAPKQVEPAPVGPGGIILSEKETAAKNLFVADAPEDSKIHEFNDYTDTTHILAGVQLELSTGNGFYYELKTDDGFTGYVSFAIGVKDNKVAYYKFLKSTEDEIGDAWIKNPKEIIGYSLTDNTIAAATVEFTGPVVKAVLDIALHDASKR